MSVLFYLVCVRLVQLCQHICVLQDQDHAAADACAHTLGVMLENSLQSDLIPWTRENGNCVLRFLVVMLTEHKSVQIIACQALKQVKSRLPAACSLWTKVSTMLVRTMKLFARRAAARYNIIYCLPACRVDVWVQLCAGRRSSTILARHNVAASAQSLVHKIFYSTTVSCWSDCVLVWSWGLRSNNNARGARPALFGIYSGRPYGLLEILWLANQEERRQCHRSCDVGPWQSLNRAASCASASECAWYQARSCQECQSSRQRLPAHFC